jgi:hypothetical protein
MEELARHGTTAMRNAVGTNRDLPSRVAALLAADPEASVRAAVGPSCERCWGNPSTPKQARQRAEKRLTSPRRAIDA